MTSEQQSERNPSAGELCANYYVHRFGLDVRGIRHPGVVSNETLPGGGTTDLADSWPRFIDGSAARPEWGWEPSYDLAAMTADMLEKTRPHPNERSRS